MSQTVHEIRVGPFLVRIDGGGRLPREAVDRLVAGCTPPESPPRRAIEVRLGEALPDAPDAGVSATYVPDPERPGAFHDANEAMGVDLMGFEAGGPLRVEARFRRAINTRERWEQALVMLLRTVVATAAVFEETLLVHGCAMAPPDGGPAVLFIGASGQGKTTMRERLPGWTALADDTVLLERGEPYRVCGTPFAGKEGHPRIGQGRALSRICVLQPGADRLTLTPLSQQDAFRELIERTFWFVSEGPLVGRLLEQLERLTAEVEVLRLASSLHHDVSGLLSQPTRRVA